MQRLRRELDRPYDARLMGSSSSPAFLLTMAFYGGTLAAARCLGQRGIPVIMADTHRRAPALWSRFVVRRERCPPVRPLERYVDWLLAHGARNPGNVLYATSDDLAWAFAQREAELRRYFRLLTPPFASVARLLDKRALYAACAAVSIRTPWTRFPCDNDELDAVAREAPYRVMVKPRTQVLFTSMRKGIIAATADELRKGYKAFLRANRYDTGLLERQPDLERPMVQEYCSSENIYAISGFCDPRRDLFVARAARKLIQWPRRAGIGIAFEDVSLDESLADRVLRLCEATGFFGVFEAEFVDNGRDRLLIDFNPRFFGQMGFDAERALPSAYLAYLAATDDIPRLRAEVNAAKRWLARGPMLFLDKTALLLTTTAERLVGRAPAAVKPSTAANQTLVFDSKADPGDRLPGIVDSALQIAWALRHAPAVLRRAARGT